MGEKVHVVAAIIERDGRFLVGKRSPHKQSAPGYWCAVCGRIEAGESQADAVVREVHEEVGLSVQAVEKVAECDTHDGSALIHWWLAAPLDDSRAALLGDEHTELRWVTLEEMRALDPVFAEDVEIFAEMVERRRVPRR
ncbi:MAG: NUDIX domain-containing protein [Nannocystis sp.]|nr:NUDIX domain-containing protein [Nannocystis sp.]MBA3544951.1 NUDIX domain-containing protein [Nannocystis sp.]